MKKITSKTLYKDLKQYVRTIVLAKKGKFSRNDIMVRIAEDCDEDVPYNTYKKAVDEVLEEVVDMKMIIKLDKENYTEMANKLSEDGKILDSYVKQKDISTLMKSNKIEEMPNQKSNIKRMKYDKPIVWPFIPDDAIIDDEF